ncbi:MAG: DUF1465 family protein [Methyloligellaceae bacterium]
MSGTKKAGGPDNVENVTIPFGEKFAESDKFSAIFQEGMGLVEDTAAYLDGEGRAEAKLLPPQASLAYATESMRLTTRLMQIASWLLIRRAVNEGELTPEQALEEKNKVKLKPEQATEVVEGFDALPIRLKELIAASHALNRRIIRLDELLNNPTGHIPERNNTILGDQLSRLREAFGPSANDS